MKQQTLVFDMTLGELSPKFRGRFDLPAYSRGATIMENMFPLLQGGFTYRPGTKYLGTMKTGKVRLIPFLISPTVNYVLELGASYMRFWRNDTLLESVGTPIEIATPYSLSALDELQYDQDDRHLIITHENYPPKVLEYQALDSFAFSTLAITGNAGVVPFQSAGNYPAVCGFFEGRLWLASTQNKRGGIWGSEPYELGNFTVFDTISYTSKVLRDPTSAFVGTITTGSMTVSGISASDIATLHVGDRITGIGIPDGTTEATRTFIQSIEASSIILTKAATGSGASVLKRAWHDPYDTEYDMVTTTRDIITAANAIEIEVEDSVLWFAAGSDLIVGCVRGERIIPSGSYPPTISCRRQTAIGSAALKPFLFEGTVVFTEASRRGVREYIYDSDTAAYQAPALSFSAEHILAEGVIDIDFQTTPTPIIWMVKADGTMVGCVYSKANGVAAWFRLETEGTIESVAVIPGAGADEVYLSVQRNGARRLERMGPLDMSEGHLDAYTMATKTLGSLTGLTWLDGAATVVYNQVAYPITVTAGTAVLPSAIPDGASVQVGYSFVGHAATMPIAAQAQLGTAHQRPKAIIQIIARVLESFAFKAGTVLTQLETAPITGPATGDYLVPISGRWDTEGVVHIIQDTPFDLTILAIQVELDAGG